MSPTQKANQHTGSSQNGCQENHTKNYLKNTPNTSKNILSFPLYFSRGDWIKLQELYLTEKSLKEQQASRMPPANSLMLGTEERPHHFHISLLLILGGIIFLLALLPLLINHAPLETLSYDSTDSVFQVTEMTFSLSLPRLQNLITSTLTGLAIFSPEEAKTALAPAGKLVIENVQTIINTTNADGLAAYGSFNNASARIRGWNSSTNDFDITDYHSEGVGDNLSADIRAVILKANHERDEFILMTGDGTNDINVQVYNSAHQWSNLNELTPVSSILATQRFAIAYEDLSGEALILWDNATTDDLITYNVWNGLIYTTNFTFNSTLPGSAATQIYLYPQEKTDRIMAIYFTSARDLGAMLWNGTDFDLTSNVTATLEGSAINEPGFSFSWEGSGEGLLFYGDGQNITAGGGAGNNLTYRTYSPAAPYWSSPTVLEKTSIDSIRTCSHPENDYIGLIYQNSSNAINATMWNGAGIIGPFLIADFDTEISGNIPNSDCTWLNSTLALFGFVNTDALGVSYFNFSTGTNTWSIADIAAETTAFNFATDDIAFLQFIKHPVTSEVMIIAQDITTDATAARWDGTAFVSITTSPLTVSLESTTNTEQGISFDWFRFDPLPNVTNVSPAGISFTVGSTVNINASIYDNIAISTVIANITHPNASVTQLTLTDGDGDKNFTATFTSSNLGSYTITIMANDTSTHKNYNTTQTGSFTLADTTPPNLTNLAPSSNSFFNFSREIELGANLSDGSSASTVSVNITFPNSSMHPINLANSTGHNLRFNSSYTIPFRGGVYTLRFFANDTSNNVNHTETTNFTADLNFTILFNGTNNFSYGFVGGTRINIFVNGSNNSLHPDNKAANGFFRSQIFDAQLVVNWSGMAWANSSNFTGAKLNFSVRSCDDSDCSGETFADLTDLSPQQLALPSNQYFQYNVSIEPDASQNTYQLYNVTINYTTSILPTAPVNISPTQDSHITNRTPAFVWTNSTDANGDIFSYHLQVDDNPNFNNPEINVSAIPPDAGKPNTTYYPTSELQVDTTYYWRVRANDSLGFGHFSTVSNFTIDSLLAFSFVISSIEFGNLDPGQSANTTDGNPLPIRAENTGNIKHNITINATPYFTAVRINTSYYQFQIRENESDSFNTSTSAVTWTNMTNSTSAFHVVDLDWHSISNDFLLDLNVTVPTDEPSGDKTSNLTFLVTG